MSTGTRKRKIRDCEKMLDKCEQNRQENDKKAKGKNAKGKNAKNGNTNGNKNGNKNDEVEMSKPIEPVVIIYY